MFVLAPRCCGAEGAVSATEGSSLAFSSCRCSLGPKRHAQTYS